MKEIEIEVDLTLEPLSWRFKKNYDVKSRRQFGWLILNMAKKHIAAKQLFQVMSHINPEEKR